MKHLIIIALFLTCTTLVKAGNDSGSGGDIYGKELEAIAKELLKVLKDNKESPIIKRHNIDLHLLELEISRTVVRSAERVMLAGEEVDAVKYLPTEDVAGLIKLNRKRWRKKNLFKRIELVAHEYLGILGLEKNNYDVSNDLTEFVVKAHEAIKQNPLLKVDLYYGYREHISTLTSPRSRSVICDTTLPEFLEKKQEARQEALNICQAYKKDCQILEETENPIISSEYIGYRYCEITAVAK